MRSSRRIGDAVPEAADRRLFEALDPNVPQISMGDKIAIKECGIAHLELLLSSLVYIEQMALVTGVNEHFVRDEIRKNQASGKPNDRHLHMHRYAMRGGRSNRWQTSGSHGPQGNRVLTATKC